MYIELYSKITMLSTIGEIKSFNELQNTNNNIVLVTEIEGLSSLVLA